MNRQDLQDERLRLMEAWLSQVLPEPGAARPASSDASFRRYFRVFSQGQSWIVMDAPPARENCAPFIAISEQLSALGVRVPVVHARDLEQGFLLLDDLGGETFLTALSRSSADVAYRRAIDDLLKIQTADAQALPAYDRALLEAEMALFHDWYLLRHRGRSLDDREAEIWRESCALLADAALAQAQVFVHRDFHSRNLMWADSGAFGVLDFQDAVQGPLSYDLVSLLRDCYVKWPFEQVHDWLAHYHAGARAAGLPVPDLPRFRQDFDLMGVQRHLKAAGIFARLCYRDGKPDYLADVPRTLAYVDEVCAHYPQLQGLQKLVQECLI